MKHLDTFKHRGVPFQLIISPDEAMEPPWVEGVHGPVHIEDARFYVYKTGRVMLHNNADKAWVYDWTDALKQCREECWGLDDAALAALTDKLGRPPTIGDITLEAVRLDMDYLRGWLTGGWRWVTISLHELDRIQYGNGRHFKIAETVRVAGIESCDTARIEEIARDLAEAHLEGRLYEWRVELAQARWERIHGPEPMPSAADIQEIVAGGLQLETDR